MDPARLQLGRPTRTNHPKQQGLKPSLKFLTLATIRARTNHPKQQGLKPKDSDPWHKWPVAPNQSSKTTRIETFLDAISHLFPCVPRTNHPKQQGLKLEVSVGFVLYLIPRTNHPKQQGLKHRDRRAEISLQWPPEPIIQNNKD